MSSDPFLETALTATRLLGAPIRRGLQILNSPDPGGVLALAKSIADGLADNGIAIETHYLTARPGMSAWAKVGGALAAALRILRGRHDVVIAYQAWPSIIVGLVGLVARKPRLIVHQTTIPSATAAPIRLLDRVIGSIGLYPVNVVNTGFTRDEFGSYPAAYRRRLRLIEHGVDRPTLAGTRASILQHHGIPDDRTILLNTGRLVYQKGQDTIIRALAWLPDCRLVIAGDGDHRLKFETLATELGVGDRVHLLGALPHSRAIELYGAADLFLFPSHHETFGISAVEAVLLGVPTVVSDISVLREVLTVGGNSAVAFVGATDVSEWTAIIRKWCDEPPPLRELEEFAAALADKYSAERMIGAYLDILNEGAG